MTEGHNSKTCTDGLICSSCRGKSFKSSAWIYTKQEIQDRWKSNSGWRRKSEKNFAGFNNSKMTGKIGTKMIGMCIVPVKVKHGDGKDIITTYVMLDNCSQGSFIHDNLVKEIGVHGMKTILNHEKWRREKIENNMVVKDIKVTGMSGDGSLLSLPKIYTRREIPADKDEIAAPAKIKAWKYLRSTSNDTV